VFSSGNAREETNFDRRPEVFSRWPDFRCHVSCRKDNQTALMQNIQEVVVENGTNFLDIPCNINNNFFIG